MPTTLQEAPVAVTVQPRMKEALLRSVHSLTDRRVRELQIDCSEDRVTVTGKSRSYYVKQLVTQAILQTVPSVRLHNNILVAAH